MDQGRLVLTLLVSVSHKPICMVASCDTLTTALNFLANFFVEVMSLS